MASPFDNQRRPKTAWPPLLASMVVLLAGFTGVAAGSSGGAGAPGVPTSPAATPATPGAGTGTAKVRDAICLTSCVTLHKASVGSTVQVTGPGMSGVRAISFRAGTKRKRVLAPVTATTATTAQAVVPRGARSGQLRVRASKGQKTRPGGDPLVIRPRRSVRTAGPTLLADAEVFPNKAFYDGTRAARLNYLVSGGQQSSDLRIDVVTADGQVVQSVTAPGVTPNDTHTLAWNGTGLDGRPVASGWYSFRLSAADGQALARRSTSHPAGLGVAVYDFIFPVRGRHIYGGSDARFGAPRSGHTHQGQDVPAPCGTPLVAARGGTIQYAGYQAAAGNYVVIDQKGSGEDNAYMHLVAPSPLHTGDRVRTGQPIGNVGETGDAVGCHLHFEVWSAPGWYEGGQPYDPLPLLRAWDRYS